MKTLTIKDLARSEHLDRPTMAAVRGGWRVNAKVPAGMAKGAASVDGAHADKDLTQRGGDNSSNGSSDGIRRP